MIQHHLQTAFRHFVRFKYSTITNVLCLSFGMTCFLCAYSVFAYFASSESGFKQASNIYTIKTQFIKNGEPGIEVVGTTNRIARQLGQKLPQLKDISLNTGLLGNVMPKTVSVGSTSIDGVFIIAADDKFFQLFDIPIIDGNIRTALRSPDGVVIGAALANKLFGTTKVAGRTITLNRQLSLEIRAVSGVLPTPSHLTLMAGRDANDKPSLNLVVPWSLYTELANKDAASFGTIENTEVMDTGNFPNTTTYFTLAPGNWKTTQLDQQLKKIMDDTLEGHTLTFGGDKTSYRMSIIPVKDALGMLTKSTARFLNIPIVPILVVFGSLLLGIAIVNFVNLYTTQLIGTRKELGAMRLMGATRWHVIIQCFVEVFLICLLALTLALLCFAALKPALSFIDFSAAWLSSWRFMLGSLAILLGVSLLAIAYPVTMVWDISPLDLMELRTKRIPSRRLSQLLIAVQFAVAGTLLILLVIIQRESAELRQLALGRMDASAIVINNNLFKSGLNYKTLATELSKHPEISNVAMADGGLWGQGFSFEPLTVSLPVGVNARRIRVDRRQVSSNYFNVMNIPLLAGHDFDPARDVVTSVNIPAGVTIAIPVGHAVDVIIDRNFMNLLGVTHPQEAIGKELHGHGYLPPDLRIVGVAENSFQGIGGTYNEATIFTQDAKDGLTIVKFSDTTRAQALNIVDTVWKQLAPNTPISRGFIVDRYRMNSGGLFMFFSIILSLLIMLAVAISVMGMIGMASYTITRRTREISIRKSLGANSRDIYKLLVRYFATPVAIATMAIAWPLGWLVSRAFLNLFPYRASIGILPFILSLIATIGIALLAVSVQSIRASLRNPAEVLRYE